MTMNQCLKKIKFFEPLIYSLIRISDKNHKFYLLYSVVYVYQLLYNWFDDMKRSK